MEKMFMRVEEVAEELEEYSKKTFVYQTVQAG